METMVIEKTRAIRPKPKKNNIGTKQNGYTINTPQGINIEKTTKKEPKKSWLYYELEEAFADVKLMIDGKKPKKTLDELIYELRNSND
jgi:hypothetical protein